MSNEIINDRKLYLYLKVTYTVRIYTVAIIIICILYTKIKTIHNRCRVIISDLLDKIINSLCIVARVHNEEGLIMDSWWKPRSYFKDSRLKRNKTGC